MVLALQRKGVKAKAIEKDLVKFIDDWVLIINFLRKEADYSSYLA